MTSADSSNDRQLRVSSFWGICHLHRFSVHVAGRYGSDCFHFRCALKKGTYMRGRTPPRRKARRKAKPSMPSCLSITKRKAPLKM
jgi:hypothetical protein